MRHRFRSFARCSINFATGVIEQKVRLGNSKRKLIKSTRYWILHWWHFCFYIFKIVCAYARMCKVGQEKFCAYTRACMCFTYGGRYTRVFRKESIQLQYTIRLFSADVVIAFLHKKRHELYVQKEYKHSLQIIIIIVMMNINSN